VRVSLRYLRAVRSHWDDRARAACQHGYMHGDCPLRCMVCGHRCEFHDHAGACQAIECGCPAWEECEDDEGDVGG
jgi:hypothetical protein